MSEDEYLDAICDSLSLESWFEGKTLTVMVDGAFVKLCLAGVTHKPSAMDLRGEPE